MDRIRIVTHSFTGGAWIAGWLFTLGYAHLSFWAGLVALIVWPYYLGEALSGVAH